MKVLKRENFRVVLTPETGLAWAATPAEVAKAEEHACKELAKQAKRHLDCASIETRCDAGYFCAYCGSPWEDVFEKDPEGPACCDAALEAWKILPACPRTVGCNLKANHPGLCHLYAGPA